ncbi:MAG: helix-turn-helix domain-containing protein, partial [Clostridiales bacterium]|jgi:AraC-like DNA-binding protein|nr:helix-turn-helix domain-containing protein [Clostridiales bacterium]
MVSEQPELKLDADDLGVRELFRYESLAAVKLKFSEILENLCAAVRANNAAADNRKLIESYERVTQDILLYVDGNYMDVNLNINKIAEKIKLTPSYMSAIFKERHGDTLINHIQKVRINRAKELIRTDLTLTMDKLAELCGFGTLKTFRAVFKAVEGVTPGAYRKICAAKE